MKIDDVEINNWNEPGEEWWKRVRDRPLESLIEATFKITLSWTEYRELFDRENKRPLSDQRPERKPT